LVRSAWQMVNTAADLASAGIDTPLIVGGAALTKKFTLTKIAPVYNGPVFYATEAMDGLAIANRICTGDEIEGRNSQSRVGADLSSPINSGLSKLAPTRESSLRSENITTGQWIETDIPDPPDFDFHIEQSLPIEEIFKYINPQMLYGKHLGIRRFTERIKDSNDKQIQKLRNQVEDVFAHGVSDGILNPRAVYRWFRAWSEEERICINHPDKDVVEYIQAPRNRSADGITAVDWLRPQRLGGDVIAAFVTTSGSDISERANLLKEDGRLLNSHILQALAIELAEATAEWLHQKLRKDWGFPDSSNINLRDLFHCRYRGIRLSIGYPALPVIEDQAVLFRLLDLEQIGVKLTDGFMMQPESSVSALIFHHPEGKYYSV
ncbi:MAG: methionine synthase, partial [Calditrichaeota bacterium]|nr:methionine synthase [Calditrichota bacterium]